MWKAKLCMNVNGSNGTSEEEKIRILHEVGFDGFFTLWVHEKIAGWRELADELGMEYAFIHAPFTKSAAMWQEGEKAEEAVQELLECVEDCARYHVPILVVHAFIGFKDHSPTQAGIINFGKVIDAAERLGVKIALENTEGEEYLAALMEAFKDREHVGFCWDTGHEMCYNHSKDMMTLYGDRLLCTHINDNLGIRDYDGRITFIDDLHLLPFDGVADWKWITERLNRHGYEGALTFELNLISKPGRHENDKYGRMDYREYATEAFIRACKVAAMKLAERSSGGGCKI